MLRYLFLFILLAHGLIHLMGFVKAFQLADIEQLSQSISKPAGILWLLATAFFLATALLFLLHSPYWFIAAFISIILSQFLIFGAWQDAKFGTIANILILLVAIVGYGSWSFENGFRKDVSQALERTNALPNEILTEADLQPLPIPVQKYLRYVGVVGKPKVNNFRTTLKGEMREKGKDWFAFTSEQYNFYDDLERLFFMKATIGGLPTHGYHVYKEGSASMQIKLLSLFSVVHLEGETLRKAETVTVFNDMCLMAPARLIDERIQWEAIDDLSAKATFTNQDISISAILYFNEEGQLINFISDDRYEVGAMQQYRFSTPLRDYRQMGDFKLMTYGEGVWHYPEGAFVYGKFNLQTVEYNVASNKLP